MLTDQDVITLLRKQIADLQECILQMAENQQSIVKAGILTNNAVISLAKKVNEFLGIEEPDVDVDGGTNKRTLQ